jgi:hypothetical protein
MSTTERMLELNGMSAAVRSARQHVKRAVAEEPTMARSLHRAAAFLRDPDEAAKGVRTLALLCSVRWVGESKARNWLGVCHVSPAARVGALTGRQRDELALRLEIYAEARP